MSDLARARELAEAGLAAIGMAERSEDQLGRRNHDRVRQAALRAAADELVPLNLADATELSTADYRGARERAAR